MYEELRTGLKQFILFYQKSQQAGHKEVPWLEKCLQSRSHDERKIRTQRGESRRIKLEGKVNIIIIPAT